jgi:hypothetical protein
MCRLKYRSMQVTRETRRTPDFGQFGAIRTAMRDPSRRVGVGGIIRIMDQDAVNAGDDQDAENATASGEDPADRAGCCQCCATRCRPGECKCDDALCGSDRTGNGSGRFRHRAQWKIATASGATSVGALALGAFSLGAFSVGALAIGALAIGRLKVHRMELDDVRIKNLRVDRLEVGECITPE